MSSNQLQAVPEKNRDLISFTNEDVSLIKSTIAVGASDAELKLFLYQCRKTGLDPLAKQIYFQKRAGKMVIITGIDGYRLVADRTGKYAGSDDPVFDDEAKPRKATVTVYKIVGGIRCPYTASARWDQYYPGDTAGAMWRKMPHLMLGKCAEALALRKAFPAELSGVYTKEEMDQADRVEPSDRAKAIEASIKAPPLRAEPLFNMDDGADESWFGETMRSEFGNVDDSVWLEVATLLNGKPRKNLSDCVRLVTGGDLG